MVYGVGFTHGVLHVAPQSFPNPHVCLRLRTGRMRYVVRGDNAAEQRRGLHPESRPVAKVNGKLGIHFVLVNTHVSMYVHTHILVCMYTFMHI